MSELPRTPLELLPLLFLLVEDWGQFWPGCQVEVDLLTWLLDLERSTAVVVVAVALGTVPVVGGLCGL